MSHNVCYSSKIYMFKESTAIKLFFVLLLVRAVFYYHFANRESKMKNEFSHAQNHRAKFLVLF